MITRSKTSLLLVAAAILAGGLIPRLRLTPAADAFASPLDIRSFGARCNGSNDTKAVQAALNALPNGGTLTFSCMAGITQVSISKRSNITIAGTNGGGLSLLTQTGNDWSYAFAVAACSSCTIKDLVFEGNSKDMVAFSIEQSSDTTVSGLTIRNVNNAGTAFRTSHNDGNKYLNNTLQNIGMGRNPATDNAARGMWVGNVSDAEKETRVTISGNTFVDIAGTALAVHGSGITITENKGIRLNWSCIKVLPLGGAGSTLVANNNCSGAGAKWQIGGGVMTEYYNSSNEQTVIRDNLLEGYASGDVSRIPDSPSVGINIANPPDKMTHNVQILNNTIRNMLYDSVQISGPADNFLIEGNLLERTISNGTQWVGINLQGDQGKVITNGTIRRNVIRGKFDGIQMGGRDGTINGVTLESNSMTSISRDGVHIEEEARGRVSNVVMTNNCFSDVKNRTVWDNRSISRGKGPEPLAARCSDPRASAGLR